MTSKIENSIKTAELRTAALGGLTLKCNTKSFQKSAILRVSCDENLRTGMILGNAQRDCGKETTALILPPDRLLQRAIGFGRGAADVCL